MWESEFPPCYFFFFLCGLGACLLHVFWDVDGVVGGVWGGKICFKDLVCLGVKISQRFGNKKIFVNL